LNAALTASGGSRGKHGGKRKRLNKDSARRYRASNHSLRDSVLKTQNGGYSAPMAPMTSLNEANLGFSNYVTPQPYSPLNAALSAGL
jgi:hypothetical protein